MFTTELIIIFFLLLLNAFFALSEMAIVSSSKPMLRQMAQQGNRRARIALQLAEDSGTFLSTVQVGITLVGTLAGAYGGATIAEKLEVGFNKIAFISPHGETFAVALVVTAITYLSVVIGELVPKQFALSNPEKIAVLIAKPMYAISKFCSPVVKILGVSADFIMKIMGVLKKNDSHISEEEMRAVVAEGAQQGTIEQSEHEMFQRIIRLGDRDVKSIMTHRVDVDFIDINDPIEVIRKKVHEAGHSRYPVIANNNFNKVLGIVQAKELLDGVLSGNFKIADYVKEAPIVPDTTSCLNIVDLFKSSPIHMAVVIDEYGATEGLITISDLMEAIVGVLPSNYDEGEHAQILQRADGSWLVDGMIAIEELNITPGLEMIPSNNTYETLAGLILYTLNQTPNEGDIVEQYGFKFEVLDMDNKRVDKVLITKIQTEEV